MVFSDLQEYPSAPKANLFIMCADIHNYKADADEVQNYEQRCIKYNKPALKIKTFHL